MIEHALSTIVYLLCLFPFSQFGPVPPKFNDSYPIPCIQAYRLTGEDEVTLPPECPPTLPPVRRCSCPDPDTVRAAVSRPSSPERCTRFQKLYTLNSATGTGRFLCVAIYTVHVCKCIPSGNIPLKFGAIH